MPSGAEILAEVDPDRPPPMAGLPRSDVRLYFLRLDLHTVAPSPSAAGGS